MFKNLGISKKLLLVFSLINLFMACSGIFNYFGFQRVTEHFLELSKSDLPKTIILGDLRASAMATARNLAMLSNSEISAELRKEYESKLKERIEQFEKAEAEFIKIGVTKVEKKSFDEVIDSWKPIKLHAIEISQLANEDVHKNEQKILNILTSELENEMDNLTKHIRELDNKVVEESEHSVAEAVRIEHQLDYINIALILTGILGLQFFSYFFTRSLVTTITSAVKELSSGSDGVASTSQEIASAATELSSITNSQSSALQQTSTAGEEINAMVERNVAGAEQAQATSLQNMKRAEEGQKSVQEMITAIQEIASNNEEIRNQMTRNSEDMTEIINAIHTINEKTKVINEIVFQTKLLSFNASVEAARAGEAGKGFAVVAEEVGNLAQMSGKSSKEITDLLDASTKQVQEIITNSELSMKRLLEQASIRIEKGITVADQCQNVLGDVVKGSSEVENTCKEVWTASQEQSKGVNEITQALSNLNQSNQEISSAAGQAATASEELHIQAEGLKQIVSIMEEMVYGKKK